MRIPHLQLSPAALRAVIEEFVTRDVELHFEQEPETCNILPMNEGRDPPASNGVA